MGNTPQQNDRRQDQAGQQNQGHQHPGGGSQPDGTGQKQPARQPGGTDADRVNRNDDPK